MIKVISSSSSGNSYIIQTEGEILLLELGISFKKIKHELNYDLSKVVGALVTHEHKDHCKGVEEALKCGIDIYMSEGTKEALQVSNHHLKIFKKDSNSRYEVINIGGFKVLAFGTEHDVLEPVGFIVYHKEIGKIAFITDSYYCRYKFKGINYYMVECNYSEDIIPTLPAWRARTLKSHQSLETLKRSLEVYDLSQCKKIILIHVSEGNGDPIRFQKEIQELTGIDTIVAGYGIEI